YVPKRDIPSILLVAVQQAMGEAASESKTGGDLLQRYTPEGLRQRYGFDEADDLTDPRMMESWPTRRYLEILRTCGSLIASQVEQLAGELGKERRDPSGIGDELIRRG